MMAQQEIYNYYKEAAQLPSPYIAKIRHIGIIAPLLTDAQYDMLTNALGIATGLDLANIKDPSKIPMFEFILRDLSLNYEKYGFYENNIAELVKIQEAFGLIVDHETHIVDGTFETYDYTNPYIVSDTTGIQPDMQQWWENFRKSRQSGTLMDKVYQFYLSLIDPTHPYYSSQFAKDFRVEYYGYRSY